MFCSKYVGLSEIHKELKEQLMYHKLPRHRGDKLYLYGIARGEIDFKLTGAIPNSERLCQFLNDKGIRAEVEERDGLYPSPSSNDPHYPVGISLRLRKKERPLAVKILKFIVYSLNSLVEFQRRVVINRNGQLEMVMPIPQGPQPNTARTSVRAHSEIPDDACHRETQASQQSLTTAEVHPIQVLNIQGEITGWSVPSSDPSREPYMVKYYRGHLSCNCLGYRYGRQREDGQRMCRHVRRVMDEFGVPCEQGNGRAVSTRLGQVVT